MLSLHSYLGNGSCHGTHPTEQLGGLTGPIYRELRTASGLVGTVQVLAFISVAGVDSFVIMICQNVHAFLIITGPI